MASATTDKRGDRKSQISGGFLKPAQTWANAGVCGASWTCIDASQAMFSKFTRVGPGDSMNRVLSILPHVKHVLNCTCAVSVFCWTFTTAVGSGGQRVFTLDDLRQLETGQLR